MADKYIKNNAGTLTEIEGKVVSAGAGDAGKIVALDATGKIDNSILPVGIGKDTQQISATENISPGGWINVFNNAGAFGVRKADGTTIGKECHGFILDAATTGNPVTVYFEGTNTQVTGQTPGVVFLSTTAGQGTANAPNASGNVVQRLGVATSATSVSFEAAQPIVLA